MSWINLEKINEFFNSKITKVILLISFFVFVSIESMGQGDFYIYYSAASKLFGDESIYLMTFCDGFHYLYSLFFAICLYPFTFLPFYLCKFLWLCLNGVLLKKTIELIISYFDEKPNFVKHPTWFYLLVVLFTFRLAFQNFHASQITIVILFLSIQAIDFIFNKDKVLLGSFLLALSVNIKLLPLVLIPYLFYRAKFKALAYVLGFCLVLWFLPSVFIGFSKNINWILDWWGIMNPTTQKNILDVEERSFHSLATLFATLFIENPPDRYALTIKRNILNLSIEQLNVILNGTRLLLAALTLYFLSSLPFKNAQSKLHQLYEVSYILAVVPLIFPHQQHYAFIFLLPAFCVLLHYVCFETENRKLFSFRVTVGFLILAFLCFNLSIILGEFNEYYEHFKIVTYGALISIGLLFYPPLKKRFV